MRFVSVMKKELKTYYTSPLAYVLTAVFLLINGYIFYVAVLFFSSRSFQIMQYPQYMVDFNATEVVFKQLNRNIGFIMLIMIPMLTMHLFAEEKKLGTIELLYTYPLRDIDIILGKFMACLTVIYSMLSITLIYPLLLSFFTPVEWPVIFSGYLGLALLTAAFATMGLFASSLTDSQVVSVVVTFGFLLFFWVIGWTANMVSSSWSDIFSQLSLIEHYEDFVKGMLHTPDITFYIIFIWFFLFLTFKVLESRNWRGLR